MPFRPDVSCFKAPSQVSSPHTHIPNPQSGHLAGDGCPDAGSASPGVPQMRPGASPLPAAVARGDPRLARGGGEGTRGQPPARVTYLGPHGAPAGPRPGPAGGRGRGARAAAGALPLSPAWRAAASGAQQPALQHPTRAQSRGTSYCPESAATPSRSAPAAEQRV